MKLISNCLEKDRKKQKTFSKGFFSCSSNPTDLFRSNYFWGQRIVYGENGASHKVEGGLISEVFHTYTVDW